MRDVILFKKGKQRIAGFELSSPPPIGSTINITTINDGVLGNDWYRIESGFVNVDNQIEFDCEWLGFTPFNYVEHQQWSTSDVKLLSEQKAKDFAKYIANNSTRARDYESLWKDYLNENPFMAFMGTSKG